ncbi:MAG: hypothetical protein AAGD00_00810 [Planctomycetota bacterium]
MNRACKKYVIATLALGATGSTAVAGDDIFLNFGNSGADPVESFGLQGDPGNDVRDVVIPNGRIIGNTSWDGILQSVALGTQGADASVRVEPNGLPAGVGVNIQLGSGGTFAGERGFMGMSDALLGVTVPEGSWGFEFFERFDNSPDNEDALWNDLDVTLDTADVAFSTRFDGSTDPNNQSFLEGPRFQSIFDRPVGTGPNVNQAGMIELDAIPFFVNESGFYNFTSLQNYAGYMHLYRDEFDPLQSVSDTLIEGDDNGESGLTANTTSQFTDVFLDADRTYFLVTSGDDPGDVGEYSVFISGPGEAFLIPAPGAMALFGMTFATNARRRRRTLS